MDDWHKSKLHLGSHLDAIDAIQPDAVEPQGTVAEKEEAGGGGGGGAAPAGGAAGKGEGTGSSSEGGSGPGSDAPSTQPPQKTKEEVVDAAVAAPVAPADPVAGEEQSPNGTAAAAAAVCEGSPDQTCVSRPVEPAAVAVPAQQHQEEDGAKQAEAEQPPHGKGPTPAEPATGGEAPSKPDDAAAPTPLAPAEEAARVASKEPAEKAPVPESGGAVGGEKPAEEEEAVPPLSQHGQTQLEAKEPQHPQQQKQPPLPVPPAPDAKQDRGEGAAPPAPSDGASVGSEQPAQAPPAAAAAEPPKAATAKEGGEPPKQQQQQQLPGSGAGMEPQEPAGVPAAGVAAGAEEDAAGAGAKPAVESPPAAAATPLSPSGGTASTSGSTSSSMPPATATLIPVVEVEPVPRPPPQPQPQQPPPQSPATTTTSTVVATINDAAAKTELMSRFRHQCLQQMRLGDFRKQKLAKLQEDLRVKGGAAASSLGSGSPYDNIFKTLMDEMTSLEINQSIFDVYVSNLHSCFVQVVDDVLLEQERARLDFAQTVAALQTRLLQAGEAQDALLRRLQRLETNFLASFAAWIIPCLLALLLLACSFLCVGRRGRHGGFGRDGAGPLAAGMGVASAGYYAAADNGPAARGGVEGAAGVVGAGGGAVANGGHHHVHYPS